MLTPEQKQKFVAARTRAEAAQRARRERDRVKRLTTKSKVQEAAEESAAQAAAQVDPKNAPPADDKTLAKRKSD